jgi:hypothetical protein
LAVAFSEVQDSKSRVVKASVLVRLTVAAAGLLPVGHTLGQVIYQATGSREDIQPVIDRFQHDIIYGPGGDAQHPPPIPGSFQVASFDDVSNAPATVLRPSRGFLTSGGITFWGGPGTPVMVSAGTADPNHPNRLFGDLDPRYPTLIEPFSAPSVVAMEALGPPPSTGFMSAGLWEWNIAETPTLVPFNAFAAVFTGAETPTTISLQAGGLPEHLLNLPVLAADPGEFSFLGAIVPEARYLAFSVYAPPLRVDPVRNLVTMDNLILGKAYPLPEPRPLLVGVVAGASLLVGRRLISRRSTTWQR